MVEQRNKPQERRPLTFKPEQPAVFGAKSHHDLLREGVLVHRNYVEDRWGARATAEYSAVMGQKIGTQARQADRIRLG